MHIKQGALVNGIGIRGLFAAATAMVLLGAVACNDDPQPASDGASENTATSTAETPGSDTVGSDTVGSDQAGTPFCVALNQFNASMTTSPRDSDAATAALDAIRSTEVPAELAPTMDGFYASSELLISIDPDNPGTAVPQGYDAEAIETVTAWGFAHCGDPTG